MEAQQHVTCKLDEVELEFESLRLNRHVEYIDVVPTGRWKVVNVDGSTPPVLFVEFSYTRLEQNEQRAPESIIVRVLRHIPVFSHFIPDPDTVTKENQKRMVDWFREDQIDVFVTTTNECQ